MGTFNYFVDIDKNVDIDVNISVDVDKFVQSFTNIDGYLAVAEAAADAFGGPGGNGTETCVTRNYLIDDFDEFQEVVVDDDPAQPSATDPNPNTGTAPGPNPGVRGGGINPLFPDGAAFPFSDTDIAEVELGAPLRTVQVANVDTGAGLPSASLGTVVIDAGGAEPGNGRLAFSSEEDTLSNDFVQYTADVNGNGEFGEPEDAFSIIVDCEDPGAIDFTDPVNNLVLGLASFGGLEIDPGDVPQTIRLEAEIEDADGDVAILRAYADSTFPNLTDVVIPLGLFLGAANGGIDGAPAGTELQMGFFSLGDNQVADIQFDEVVRITFSIFGDPDDPVTGSDVGVQAVENPTPDAFDLSFDDFEINSECCTRTPGEGALSETETFAQVDSVTGFTEAFSMSLAATNDADFDFI